MQLDTGWSPGQRALLRFLEQQGVLTKEPIAPGAGRPTNADLFAAFADAIDQQALVDLVAQALRIAAVDLEGFTPEPELVSLVPVEVARRGEVVPIARHEGTLEVAAVNPLDLETVKSVEFTTGLRVRTKIARREDVCRALSEAYGIELETPPPAAPRNAPSPEAAQDDVQPVGSDADPAPVAEPSIEASGPEPEAPGAAESTSDEPAGEREDLRWSFELGAEDGSGEDAVAPAWDAATEADEAAADDATAPDDHDDAAVYELSPDDELEALSARYATDAEPTTVDEPASIEKATSAEEPANAGAEWGIVEPKAITTSEPDSTDEPAPAVTEADVAVETAADEIDPPAEVEIEAEAVEIEVEADSSSATDSECVLEKGETESVWTIVEGAEEVDVEDDVEALGRFDDVRLDEDDASAEPEVVRVDFDERAGDPDEIATGLDALTTGLDALATGLREASPEVGLGDRPAPGVLASPAPGRPAVLVVSRDLARRVALREALEAGDEAPCVLTMRDDAEAAAVFALVGAGVAAVVVEGGALALDGRPLWQAAREWSDRIVVWGGRPTGDVVSLDRNTDANEVAARVQDLVKETIDD